MNHNFQVQKLNEVFKEVLSKCPELVFIGEDVLRKATKEVSLEEGIEIGEQLKKVLEIYRSITGFGRGLAAPQIGISKAVFVTFIENNFKVYINPKVTSSSSNLNLYRESCLSCGYLSVDVKRPESVEIKYLNTEGVIVSEKCESFLGRLIQHEYDHLLGVVNIDKAEPVSIEFATNDPLKEQLRSIP